MPTRPALPRAAVLGFAVAIATLAACSDSSDSALISGPSPANVVAPDLDTQINTLVDELFKQGHATSVHARWRNAKRENMRFPDSRKKHVQLVRWLQSKTADVTTTGGETQEHAVARLVLLMSIYMYGGPEAEPPAVEPATDATLEIVQPAETDTVTTPAEQAAVIFPAGATNEETIVVVNRVDQHFEKECSGPLPTKKCQYPQFYEFNVFPDVKLNTPAQVAVCHINDGEHRTPRADHDRFRLAHQVPADPAARHPHGMIVDGIEILPFVNVGETLIECEENTYPSETASVPGRGMFALALASATVHVRQAARFIGRALTPKSLYAIDRGGGGEVLFFSTFGTVDPESQADLEPEPGFSVSSATVARGDPVTVNAWSIGNNATASAYAFTSAIVLAEDTTLTTGAVTLASLAEVAELEPGNTLSLASMTVVIPEGTAPGTYYLGALVDDGNDVAESAEGNNYVSARITVIDPYTRFCPAEGAPAGSYSSMRLAVDSTPPGGTIKVCDGTWDMDTVVVNKPLTITSESAGGNAWIGDVDQSAVGTQSGRPALVIDGYASGVVRIVDIGFRMKGRAVQIGRPSITSGGTPGTPPSEGNPGVPGTPPTAVVHPGVWEHVDMDNVRFVGRNSTFGIGVQVWESGVSTGRLTITNSYFNQFGIGVFVTSHSEANVNHSTFENFTSGSVTYSGRTTGNVALDGYSFGKLEDNVIRNCGDLGCVRAVVPANVEIRGNHITAGAGNPAQSKLFGILVTRRFDTPHPRSPIVIEGNTIIGGRTDADVGESDPLGWQFRDGIFIQDKHGVTNIVRGNSVSGANILLRAGADVSVHDNFLVEGYGGFFLAGLPSGGPTRVGNFNRNDVTSTTKWFFWAPGGDFTCNWWGTNDAPPPEAVNPPSTPSTAYNPRATGPIAGTATSCP